MFDKNVVYSRYRCGTQKDSKRPTRLLLSYDALKAQRQLTEVLDYIFHGLPIHQADQMPLKHSLPPRLFMQRKGTGGYAHAMSRPSILIQR